MIEKNVPIPKDAPRGSHAKYPELRSMDIGDSVFFAGQKTTGKAATAARVYALRAGKQFRACTMDGGVRIWRIK